MLLTFYPGEIHSWNTRMKISASEKIEIESVIHIKFNAIDHDYAIANFMKLS